LLLGATLGASPNWWFDFDQGSFYLRLGTAVHGYHKATGESVWGPPSGLHWKLDPTASRLSVYNGNTELRYFDGDTGYINGWDGVGQPLGPGIRWGMVESVDGDGRPILDASGNQVVRYAWRVIGVNGVPVISALSGTSEDADDAIWMIGRPDASDNFLRWSAGELDIRGEMHASSGVIGGLTIGATYLSGGNMYVEYAGQIRLGYSSGTVWLSATDATWRLGVGDSAISTCPFRVDQYGNVYATKVMSLQGTTTGNIIDIRSTLDVAVRAQGAGCGLYGVGEDYGVQGYASAGTGVFGYGTVAGVQAVGVGAGAHSLELAAAHANGGNQDFEGLNYVYVQRLYVGDTSHYLYLSGDNLMYKPGAGDAVQLN
jgi:hypothetical protein